MEADERRRRVRGEKDIRQTGPWILVAVALMAAWPAAPPRAEGVPAADGRAPEAVRSAGGRISERIVGLPGLPNAGRVGPGIYRGAQPKPEGYATLAALGIRTVVNLRAGHGEREAVESLGMRSVEIPMKAYRDVDAETVEKVMAVMRDPALRPVFVHCAQGQDRTGVVVAVYRMEVDGWSEAEAEAEMQMYGFNDVWRPLMEFVREYRAKPAP